MGVVSEGGVFWHKGPAAGSRDGAVEHECGETAWPRLAVDLDDKIGIESSMLLFDNYLFHEVGIVGVQRDAFWSRRLSRSLRLLSHYESQTSQIPALIVPACSYVIVVVLFEFFSCDWGGYLVYRLI